MKPLPPPKALKFLRWFCREDYLEEIEGDLTELFEKRYNQSPAMAKRQFTWSVVRYFRPGFIKSIKTSYQPNSIAMFRHNLLLTFRTFERYKTSFIINLMGLTSGLACVLLIYLWVNDELSVDKFHEKDAQLYQAMLNHHQADGIATSESTPSLLAGTLAKEIPGVEYSVSAGNFLMGKGTLSVDNKAVKASGIYAGNDYFNIFSYVLVRGNKNQVLADENSIVISEKLAINLFNTTEGILGKSVEFQKEERYLVSGVFKETPSNSSFQFDFIIPFGKYLQHYPNANTWDNNYPKTFLVLKKGIDVARFNNKIADLIKNKSGVKTTTLFVRPYSDRHLYNNYENGVLAGGRITYVKLFSIVAAFILLIACINLMNLSTAKASARLKEVMVKKSVGARRKTLVFQYLGESMLITGMSVFLAFLFVIVFLPRFNEITGKQLTLHFVLSLVLPSMGITFFTGLVAGSYPALYFSGFNPVNILKGKPYHSLGSPAARKGLVVFQFILSIVLIVCVLVVKQQIGLLQDQNLGYDKDNIIYFKREGKAFRGENLETLISQLKSIPGIIEASSTSFNFVGLSPSTNKLDWPGKKTSDQIEFHYRLVNYNLIEMLAIEVKEGRAFSEGFSSDRFKIIANEAAIDIMGLRDPVGAKVKFMSYDMEILGVVKNFNFQSLHESVKPFLFLLSPGSTETVMAKIQAGQESATISRLQQFYKEFNPGFVLDYGFLDQDYQAQYEAEQRVATLSHYFAGIAILISCLGLFGLATFTTERRLKEIGIRKILGSGNFGLIYLLSKDFTNMVVMAIMIALPLSYFVARQWLQSFAFQVDLAWWYFAAAGGAALLIAWLTVGLRTVKAAMVNPVECLKDE